MVPVRRVIVVLLAVSGCWTVDTLAQLEADPFCGDGIVRKDLQPGQIGFELCDDGNTDENDGCTTLCMMPVCGDGIHSSELGEQCDDGNGENEDSCTNRCERARCGDGYRFASEEACDDGNQINDDGCPNDCSRGFCGDGYIWPGVETCDDGNRINTDLCPASCQVARCGDGYVGPGEGCDDGNDNDYDACADCRPAGCGDGELRAGVEVCDDGNDNDADNCTNNCSDAVCGDGIRRADIAEGQPGFEACDDGNLSNDDFCTNTCELARCGDGFVQPGESCDDDNPGCVDCISAICGNGRLDAEEECDDGNRVDTDTCRNDCQTAICGDRIVQAGVEQCDDGNKVDFDACRNTCELPRCGDGIKGPGELCDDGNEVDGDRCGNDCQFNFCGAGLEIAEDADGDGYTRCQGDCADNNPKIFPKVAADQVAQVLFVDADQEGQGDGSDANPYASISEVIEPLRQNPIEGHTVICVANGQYDEQAVNLRGMSNISILGQSLAVQTNWVVLLGPSQIIKVAGITTGSFIANNSSGSGSLLIEISENRLGRRRIACSDDLQCDDEVYQSCTNGYCRDRDDLDLHYTVSSMRLDRNIRIANNFIGAPLAGFRTIYSNGSAFIRYFELVGNTIEVGGSGGAFSTNWDRDARMVNNTVRWVGGVPGQPEQALPFMYDGSNSSGSILFGNTMFGGAGGGLRLRAFGWAWANRGFGEGGISGGLIVSPEDTVSVGYNLGTGYPESLDLGLVELARCVGNFDSAGNRGDCYAETAPFVAPFPTMEEITNEQLVIDADDDGDDDRGDTLCTIGAWGRANPLFGAVDLEADDLALHWAHCDGDNDEVHTQAAFQVQLGADERFEQILYQSEVVESTEGLASLEGIAPDAGHLRVRLRNQHGAWSAWSAGLVPWARAR